VKVGINYTDIVAMVTFSLNKTGKSVYYHCKWVTKALRKLAKFFAQFTGNWERSGKWENLGL
jgi:hypothetical protein